MDSSGITSAYRVHLNNIDTLLEKAEAEYVQYLHSLNKTVLFFDQSPVPMWVKAYPSLVMLAVNKGYRDQIGKFHKEYVGKTDFDIWPTEIAEKFKQNDHDVFNNKKPLVFNETWEENNKSRTALVLKFPIFDSDKIIAIGGAIIDQQYLEGLKNV